jgi:hypothetical protein
MRRAARGLVAASACTLLAYWGHADAGDALPNAAILTLLALPLAALTILLADRRRGPLAIFALVGGSQLALHLLLELLGGGVHHMGAMPGMSGTNPLMMTGAHALASLVTAAVLAGAEQAALACACALVDALIPAPEIVTGVPTQPPVRMVATSVPGNLRLRDVLTRRLNLRRGPPMARLTPAL